VKTLETDLRALRDSGRKALVPYFMAGVTKDWSRHVEAAVLGGADAIEIGIPFSDPMMDGVVIQEAALKALQRKTTFESICQELEFLQIGVPLIAMTYYNMFLHYGLERSAGRLQRANIAGAIVPDLPLEENAEWQQVCDASDVATIYLVAPSSSKERAAAIATSTQGFAYATARMAVTGMASDEGDGPRVVSMVRDASDVPVYVGIGITTPAQARSAAESADGVIVGSALVKIILDGAEPNDVEEFVRSFRTTLDTVSS
jgi:tryptophan synthase alpha chain